MVEDRIRVLIADDDGDIRSSYRDLLESYSFTVDEAVNGEEAFKLAQEGAYSLYITDVRMPKMGGFEYISQLRHIDNQAVIIIISGIDDINYSMRALEFGAWRYLIKPVNSDTFFSVVYLGLKEHLHRLSKDRQAILMPLVEVMKKPTPKTAPAPLTQPIPEPVFARSVPAMPAIPEPVVNSDLNAFRKQVEAIKEEALADFSRKVIELKLEALQTLEHEMAILRSQHEGKTE
jgi:FixJ family two-component response regulator